MPIRAARRDPSLDEVLDDLRGLRRPVISPTATFATSKTVLRWLDRAATTGISVDAHARTSVRLEVVALLTSHGRDYAEAVKRIIALLVALAPSTRGVPLREEELKLESVDGVVILNDSAEVLAAGDLHDADAREGRAVTLCSRDDHRRFAVEIKRG